MHVLFILVCVYIPWQVNIQGGRELACLICEIGLHNIRKKGTFFPQSYFQYESIGVKIGIKKKIIENNILQHYFQGYRLYHVISPSFRMKLVLVAC